MRSGAQVCFRASLAEIRIAAGFEGYGKDIPVVNALRQLAGEILEIDEDMRIPVFDRVEIMDRESRMLEWVFTPDFSDLFVSPRIYAIVSISEIVHLKSGLDFFLYLQVRRVWKMNKRSVNLDVLDLGRAAGLDEQVSFQRVSERVRRSSGRLEGLLGGKILLQPIKAPGARYHEEMKITVRAAS